MTASNRIEARIGGNVYTLVTGDDEVLARRVAAEADRLVRQILQSNTSLNQTAALALGLVNAVDLNLQFEGKIESLEARLVEAEGRVSESRSEMLRFRERMEVVNNEILRLRTSMERTEREARQTSQEDRAVFGGRIQTSIQDALPSDPLVIDRHEEEC